MSTPRLLDLFCGAGGAAKGYQRAGFHVTGVDIRPQPNYCGDEFVQDDALGLLAAFPWWDLSQFAAMHASPPCQRYMRSGNVARSRHPDLLGPTRELLRRSHIPWVIENVPGAPMRPDAVLCGSMFGLPVRRHRWFEFSWAEPVLTLACDHSRPITGVYGNPHGQTGAYAGMLPSDLETWSDGLGIDWMTTSELANAIPPAYTALVGGLLMERVRASRRSLPGAQTDLQTGLGRGCEH